MKSSPFLPLPCPNYLFSYTLLILLFLSGCRAPTPPQTTLPLQTPRPIKTSSPTNTLAIRINPTCTSPPTIAPTVTQEPSPTNSPTPLPQILGRIFPEKFNSQAVWSNAGGNARRNFRDQGWFCPPDGSTTDCSDFVIHFDISIPTDFGENDQIYSPVDGYVYNIYDTGYGKSIQIMPEPGLSGIEALLANKDRISSLSKGVFQFDYELNDVGYVSLHLAHVTPLVKIGDEVTKGEPIAYVYFDVPFNPKVVSFVLYIHMKDGTMWQFSPCDVANETEFCGKCTPGSPYPCP
jgi:hypothetical protein